MSCFGFLCEAAESWCVALKFLSCQNCVDWDVYAQFDTRFLHLSAEGLLTVQFSLSQL